MKKTLLAMAVAATSFGSIAGVTYHAPDPQMEENLQAYGTGIADWEYSKFARLTLVDSHKIHYWAEIAAPAEKMPMKKAKFQYDVSKVIVDDVVPNNTISLYNLMRDRAEISSYVIMNKDGEIIAEDYWNNSKVDTKHQLHSANKSFTALAWAAAEAKGLVSADEIAENYIDELKGTKWGKITMRHYLDMTSGSNLMDMSREGWHNWEMPDGNVTDSSMSTVAGYAGLVKNEKGELVPPVQASPVKDITRLSEYLEAYAHRHDPEWEAGEKYQYRCLNTEMVAMALVRVMDKPLAEVYDELLWSKGGFNHYGAFYVNQDKDSIGSGAYNTSTRDFAIGSYLMVNKGKNWKGEQIFSEKFVEEVEKGDPVVKNAWDKISYEGKVAKDAWYKNQFRTINNKELGVNFSMMLGTNGQVSAWDHNTGNIIAIFGDYRQHTSQAMSKLYFFDVIQPIFKDLAEKQAK
ncbi:serine hydrolase [Vibrio jasicida]|uniref:serine hydrolase n=1 Tax=Vibrio jasicida TaxID=766224 RepID=UPI000CE35405|nr:serine hydrolase domain-containing protein [Vibrio jasicida]